MKKMSSLAVVLLLLAFSLLAREVAGVKMVETVKIDGKELKLNGMGLRSKAIFKVYVAGLYAETPSNNAANLVGSEQTKQVRLVMLRDLSKSKISEAVIEGFEKNSKAQMPKLKQRLDQFIAAIPDLKETEHLVITYIPGKGTTLSTKAGDRITTPGKDFSDALFSVWLGATPVDEKLKQGLLGS